MIQKLYYYQTCPAGTFIHDHFQLDLDYILPSFRDLFLSLLPRKHDQPTHLHTLKQRYSFNSLIFQHQLEGSTNTLNSSSSNANEGLTPFLVVPFHLIDFYYDFVIMTHNIFVKISLFSYPMFFFKYLCFYEDVTISMYHITSGSICYHYFYEHCTILNVSHMLLLCVQYISTISFNISTDWPNFQCVPHVASNLKRN